MARALTLFSRALLARCPVCGGRGIFASWFSLKERCPTCGHRFGRGESGYQLGAMALALLIPEGIWIASFVAILVVSWPSPPWTLLQWGSPVAMVGLPLLVYPLANTLAVALDVLFRPVDPRDSPRSAR